MLRMVLKAFDPNDATHLNQVFLEPGEKLRTRTFGTIELGELLGQGSGGKVFTMENSLAVKVIRRHRTEKALARLLVDRPAPNAIPILAVADAGDYATIIMPRGEEVEQPEVDKHNLEVIYEPMEIHLRRLGYRYCDGRVARNLVRFEERITIIDFSHARRLRRDEIRL